MNEISQELRRIHPRFRLAYASVAQAYQTSNFVITRVARDIYISVKFPVTTESNPYTLYKLALFPIVTPNNDEHATLLDTKTIAFAYSRLSQYYIEFQSMPVVYEHTLDISLYGETFRSITNPTCIWALFTKTSTLIQQLCTFHLVPHQLTPSIRFLDASIILFTKVTNITRTCVGRNTVQLQPCIQCVYRLPCRCSFHTEIGYVAPSLEFCGPITNNRTQRPVSHVTNLAILKYFF